MTEPAPQLTAEDANRVAFALADYRRKYPMPFQLAEEKLLFDMMPRALATIDSLRTQLAEAQRDLDELKEWRDGVGSGQGDIWAAYLSGVIVGLFFGTTIAFRIAERSGPHWKWRIRHNCHCGEVRDA